MVPWPVWSWFIGGSSVGNLDTRIPPLGLMSRPLSNSGGTHPIQSSWPVHFS